MGMKKAVIDSNVLLALIDKWLYPDVPELFGDIMRLMKDKEGKLSFYDALMSLFVKDQGLAIL